MIQEPFRDPPRTYIAYVDQDTRLDIIYISEALDAIIGLHDAPATALKPERRVYNIAGIKVGGQAPAALDIKNAVLALQPNANIQFQKDQTLQTIVQSFGILDDTAAQTDWGWKGAAQRIDLPHCGRRVQRRGDQLSEADQISGAVRRLTRVNHRTILSNRSMEAAAVMGGIK
jgi:hypothetical protein